MDRGNSQAWKEKFLLIYFVELLAFTDFSLFCTCTQSHRIWECHRARICPVLWLPLRKRCCASNPSFWDAKRASVGMQSRLF